jgi:hypothetical protein
MKFELTNTESYPLLLLLNLFAFSDSRSVTLFSMTIFKLQTQVFVTDIWEGTMHFQNLYSWILTVNLIYTL